MKDINEAEMINSRESGSAVKISDARIAEAFDGIAMNDNQREAVWGRVLRTAQAADEFAPEKPSCASKTAWSSCDNAAKSCYAEHAGKKISIRRRLAAAAVLIVMLAVAVLPLADFGGEPSLQGYVYAAESRETGMIPEELLVDTADPTVNADIYVYAPAIYYLDGSRLVFGNDTGLVIYNLLDKKLEGLIDMQAICSGYYNCDSVNTHVFVKQGNLYVYNAKANGESENPFGWYHVFDLGELDGSMEPLKYIEAGNDDETMEKIADACKEYESEHLADAWNSFSFLTESGLEDELLNQSGSRSQNVFTYKDEAGPHSSILIWRGWKINGGESEDDTGFYPSYELCTAAEGDKDSAVFTEIDLGIDDEMRYEAGQYNTLPVYRYTGSDPALKAVCEYKASWDDELEFSSVMIPAPVVYGKVQKGDELLVFGNFWNDTYVKKGNTLVTTSGGEMPSCFHLVKGSDGYKVSSVDEAMDGEDYLNSIKEFTKGHPLIYLKFKAYSGSGHSEKIRKQAVRDYVTANGLDIKYYKDYGWDPMPLFKD